MEERLKGWTKKTPFLDYNFLWLSLLTLSFSNQNPHQLFHQIISSFSISWIMKELPSSFSLEGAQVRDEAFAFRSQFFSQAVLASKQRLLALFFFPQQAVFLLLSCDSDWERCQWCTPRRWDWLSATSCCVLGAPAWVKRLLKKRRPQWALVREAALLLGWSLLGEGKWAEAVIVQEETFAGGLPQIIECIGNTESCGRTEMRARATIALAVRASN